MCFLPLQEVWPLTGLGTQLRATFVMCIGFVVATNLFTMTLDEWRELDEEEEEDTEEDEEETEEGEKEVDEEAAGETDTLLHTKKASGGGTDGARGSGSARWTVQRAEIERKREEEEHTEVVIDSHISKPSNDEADDTQGESGGRERREETKGAMEEEHLSLLASLLAFRLLSPPLLALWMSQFTWWLVVMQCSFWWTTWVGIEVYGGDPLTSPDVFYEGVSYGIIGTLVHSVVSLFSSHALIAANNSFGVTRVYHVSAIVYSVATAALWWWRSKEASMAYMIGTGFLYPVINTNPFIIIELQAEEGEGRRNGRDVEETSGSGCDAQ